MPMENMKTPHTFREEWLKSRYSTAENYIPQFLKQRDINSY